MPIDFSKHKKGDVVRVHCCDNCTRAAGIQPKCPPDSGSRSWPCEVCGHWGIGSATDCTIGDWLILHPNKRLTAETSNARGEWVLVPRELTQEMRSALARAVNASCNTDEWYAHTLAAAPPPADAEPKTLPVPTRVYLTDKAAVIVGDPQRGWDEEGPDAHNCDAMGCATIGPHVLARVPFTDERALSQQPEAQGGGEVAAWETEDGRVISARQKATALRDGGASASSVAPYTTPLYRTAPPSAPVGVEGPLSLLRAGHWREVYIGHRCMRLEVTYDYATWERLMAEVESALAQQPAAVECDCPAGRIDHASWCAVSKAQDAALAAQQQGGRDHG